jgi:hypothetical protein
MRFAIVWGLGLRLGPDWKAINDAARSLGSGIQHQLAKRPPARDLGDLRSMTERKKGDG